MKKQLIVDRKKFSRFILIVTLALALVLTAIINAIVAPKAYGREKQELDQREEKTRTVVLQTGDTIWSTAEPIAQAQGMDTREVVRAIYRLNKIESSQVAAGQRLLVPDYSPAE